MFVKAMKALVELGAQNPSHVMSNGPGPVKRDSFLCLDVIMDNYDQRNWCRLHMHKYKTLVFEQSNSVTTYKLLGEMRTHRRPEHGRRFMRDQM